MAGQGFGIKAELQGMAEILLKLEALKQGVRGRITRKAVSEAIKPILKDAKQRAAKSSGLLTRSISHKVKTYRSTGVTVGLIGPRRGLKKLRVVAKSRRKRADLTKVVTTKTGKIRYVRERYVNPVRYAHLVELGRGPIAVKGKRALTDASKFFGLRAAAVRPRPFLRTAWDAGRSQAQATIAGIIAAEIETLAAKKAPKEPV